MYIIAELLSSVRHVSLRRNWPTVKAELITQLTNNTYHLSPLKRHYINGDSFDVWEAIDSLVIKATALAIEKRYEIFFPKSCTHVKGHEGCQGAVEKVRRKMPQCEHFCKSDVNSYYASMDHTILLDLLKQRISCPTILSIVKDVCERIVWTQGYYETVKDKSIPRGCSLSPLLAAIYLMPLDHAMKNLKEVMYVRFMDDEKTQAEFDAIIASIRQSNLSDPTKEFAIKCIQLACRIPMILSKKDISLSRLKNLIFGKGYRKKGPGGNTNKGNSSASSGGMANDLLRRFGRLELGSSDSD